MSKFQSGKIYKIVDNTSDMVYVGSTCKSLEQRLKEHESAKKSFNAGKFAFTSSFNIINNNDYKIELVENYPCNNKQELNIREGQIIQKLKNDNLNIVNKYIAGQTKAQYYQNNKNIINNKQSQKHNCQCGGKYTNANKTCHEKSKKHCEFINNTKTINNHGSINITINVNSAKELNQLELEFLNAIKK